MLTAARIALVRIYEAMASMLELLHPPVPAAPGTVSGTTPDEGTPSAATSSALMRIVEYLRKCQEMAHHSPLTAEKEGLAFHRLGLCYERLGDLQQAVDVCERENAVTASHERETGTRKHHRCSPEKMPLPPQNLLPPA